MNPDKDQNIKKVPNIPSNIICNICDISLIVSASTVTL